VRLLLFCGVAGLCSFRLSLFYFSHLFSVSSRRVQIKDEAAEQRAREALAAVNAELQKSLARRARGKQRRVNRAQVRRPPQARVQFAMDILGDGTLPSVP
jgi:hypothetical protein